MLKKENLKRNKKDFATSITKSVVGSIPFAGTLLSELIGNLIPNQRIDRLSKYIKELDDKLSKIPVDKLENLSHNEKFIDLIEEGFVQASRAITDDRRKYIASIIANGINDKTIELEESKYLLKIFQELNDIEIIWLRFYAVPTIGGDEEFRKKHENILTPLYAFINADKEELNKAAIQKSYKEHLERLELIHSRVQVDSSGLPEFEKFTGEPKTAYKTITQLGKLLLSQVGLTDE